MMTTSQIILVAESLRPLQKLMEEYDGKHDGTRRHALLEMVKFLTMIIEDETRDKMYSVLAENGKKIVVPHLEVSEYTSKGYTLTWARHMRFLDAFSQT